jgi:hypothetical protein
MTNIQLVLVVVSYMQIRHIIHITSKRTADRYASPYLEDEEGSRLFYGEQNSVFTFLKFQGEENSPLRNLAAALPRLPLKKNESLQWQDNLAMDVLLQGSQLAWSQFKGALGQAPTLQGKWHWQNDQIMGKIATDNQNFLTRLRFNETGAIVEATVNGSQLCRIDSLQN